MIKTDLSTKVLLVRKMLAEKATPGPWLINDRNTSTPFDISIENGTCFCQIVWGTKRQDTTHIAANSPDVVIATIDELLRLREENERLKEGLENALHVNELRLAEIAKTLITGLAEGITGNSESVTAQIRATCVHCNASFTSAEEATAHDKVCPKHPANIKAKRLEKEIDWLAQAAANCEWMGRRVSPKFMREAARRAVEEVCSKN